jgi:hypothetical protein
LKEGLEWWKRHKKKKKRVEKINQILKKKRKKEKDIVKKEIKSCLKMATGICSNQTKKVETSCNHLLKVYYSTWWRGKTHWEYPSPLYFKL